MRKNKYLKASKYLCGIIVFLGIVDITRAANDAPGSTTGHTKLENDCILKLSESEMPAYQQFDPVYRILSERQPNEVRIQPISLSLSGEFIQYLLTQNEGGLRETRELYREKIAPVVQAMRQGRPVKKAIYSAAGYDIDSAFSMLLPDVEVIVGEDSHPFVGHKKDFNDSDLLHGLTKECESHFLTTHLYSTDTSCWDKNEPIAPRLLMRLFSRFNHLRIVSIIAITVKQKDARELSDGLITFDFGPGTPLRSYYHIHVPIERKNRKYKTEAEEVVNLNIQQKDHLRRLVNAATITSRPGIIVKANDGAYSDSGIKFSPTLLKSVKARGGLIIDGDAYVGELLLKSRISHMVSSIDVATGYNRTTQDRNSPDFSYAKGTTQIFSFEDIEKPK